MKNIKWLEMLGKKVNTRRGVSGQIVEVNYDTVVLLTDGGNQIPVSKDDVIL